jgi:hypothetical protein
LQGLPGDCTSSQQNKNESGRKHPHRSTKDDIVFLVGLDVMEMEAVGCSNLGRLESVYPVQWAQENQDSANQDLAEVLYYCNLYDMCGYDKYVHLDFEIVLNSLAAGKDTQISEDNSLPGILKM